MDRALNKLMSLEIISLLAAGQLISLYLIYNGSSLTQGIGLILSAVIATLAAIGVGKFWIEYRDNQIYDFLLYSGGRRSKEQICSELGLSHDRVEKSIRRLVRAERIDNFGGLYGVKHQTTSQQPW